MPYSYQSSIGFQRQLGSVMAFDADYIFTAARHQTVQQDINLAYNPATGINYPFTDRTRKPYAAYGWDQVSTSLTEGKDNYQTLQMSFTKRMANRWMMNTSFTYNSKGVSCKTAWYRASRYPRPAPMGSGRRNGDFSAAAPKAPP